MEPSRLYPDHRRRCRSNSSRQDQRAAARGQTRTLTGDHGATHAACANLVHDLNPLATPMLEPIRGRRRLQPGRKQAREDIAPTRRVARTMARITPSSNDRRRIVAIAMARYAGPREVEAMVRAGRLDARPGDSESRGSQAARLLLLRAVTRASDSRMAPAVREGQSRAPRHRSPRLPVLRESRRLVLPDQSAQFPQQQHRLTAPWRLLSPAGAEQRPASGSAAGAC